MKITTKKQVRDMFWETYPEFANEFKKGKRQNQYTTDIRCCFVDFVDSIRRDNVISEKLANNVTL